MLKRFTTILIAPMLVLGCGEEPTIQRYEVTEPIAFDWPVTQEREAEVEVDDLTWVWEVPAGWIDAPEVPDQLVADYRFKGASDVLPGRLTVSVIDGDAGGVNANVLRWLQQLYVTDARSLGPKDRVEDPMRVPFGFATFVELHGQYQGEHSPTHIFAAIVQIPADDGSVYQTWFFKLAGDEATVTNKQNQLDVVMMVLNLRTKGADKPNLSGIRDRGGVEPIEEETEEEPGTPDPAKEPVETP